MAPVAVQLKQIIKIILMTTN